MRLVLLMGFIAMIAPLCEALTGGTPANTKLAPGSSIVEIQVEDSTAGDGSISGTCTGTLIGPQFVLTAGHCFILSRNPDDITVLIKHSQFLSSFSSFTVAAVEIPTEYDPRTPNLNKSFDIALLKLRNKPNFSVTPIQLADSLPALHSRYTIFGFGKTSSLDNDPFSSTLAEGNITLAEQLSSGLFDTGFGQSVSACPGDSGGPLLAGSGLLVAIIHAIGADLTPAQDSELKNAQDDLAVLQQDYPMQNFCSRADTFFVPIAPRLAWLRSLMNQ